MTETGRAPRVRLFVALELPPDVRASLAGWREGMQIPALRALPDDSLHVTLCFLGGQESSQLPSVLSAVVDGASDLPAAPLRLGEGLWLPPRGPRVLAVGLVDSVGALGVVHARLSDALSAGGWYRPERRRYLPHVTVARVRHGSRVRAAPLAPPAALAFTASRVTLLRSRLSPAGARYEPLGSVELPSDGRI